MLFKGRVRAGVVRHGLRLLVLADALAVQSVEGRARRLAFTISGTVADERGRALEGVSIQLSGATRGTTMTRANGTYVIDGTVPAGVPGQWTVRPTRSGCRFVPSSATASASTAGTVVDFTGSGESCTGTIPAVTHDMPAFDPGPRPGPPGAGGPVLRPPNASEEQAAAACLPGLAAPMLRLCEQAFIRFQKVESVSGTLPGEEGAGLGPTFNGNGCAMCHAQPAILGSAPAPFSPQRPIPNPQVALATLDGARNAVPPFITPDGPIRVVRFKRDNDVHGVYTIAGRSDARRCAQAQPDFAAHAASGDVALRIPLSLFGLGLVEAVSDATLRANLAESSRPELGIAGTFNTSPNDGTISRFGRKAQDKSLLLFAAEAYNVEVGVTNELFPEERHAEPGCAFNGIPEDITDPTRVGTTSELTSDIQNFAFAIRLSAPPTPALPPGATQAEVDDGRVEFENIGCGNCHTPTLRTSTSNLDPVLSKVAFHPYSDFALHHMGVGLADGIVQGAAGPDQFRTTPLWGLGQRLFFLHDGRTTDLVQAVEAHASTGSEANTVITNFNVLSGRDQQHLIEFLRSL
ncbi:MAG TPA: di-heme oxidoredictase family protein [Polyangiaceae bacterium]|nr:di-heme oxidoredictase family protein [Polyangiaceae bacterium]